MASDGKSGPPDISSMHTLKVDNLTYQTGLEGLRSIFGKYGEIGDVYIPRHFGTGDPKGYAFVRFYDLRDAEDAMSALNGKELEGRELRIQMARNKRPEDPKSFYSNGKRIVPREGAAPERARDRSRDRYVPRRSRSAERRRQPMRRSSSRSRSRSGGRDRGRDRDRDRDRIRDYDRRGDTGYDRRDERDRGVEYRPRYDR